MKTSKSLMELLKLSEIPLPFKLLAGGFFFIAVPLMLWLETLNKIAKKAYQK